MKNSKNVQASPVNSYDISQSQSLLRWLCFLKVGQKIGLGYGLAIVVAILGTSTGFIIGDRYHKEALELEEKSLKAYTLVNQLKSQALLIRLDWLEIPFVLDKPELVKQQYAYLLEHQAKFKQLWLKYKSKFNALKDEEQETIIAEHASSREFFNTYYQFPDIYLKQVERLIESLAKGNIPQSSLETTRKEITNFNNRQISRELEQFARDLLILSEKMYEEYEKAEAEFGTAQKLRFHIFAGSAISSIILAILLAILTSRAISYPLQTLTNISQKVTEQENFELQVPVTSKDEISILASSFNQMIQRVKQLLLEKEQRARELLEANQKLKQTQQQLIAKERLAALGSLTAGIAHEINTPLGISISAASSIKEDTSLISQKFTSGTMKRSELSDFVHTMEDSSSMLLGNLRRAAELVQSFKQVAVDQSSEKQRVFEFKQYLEEVLLQLNPKIKTSKHTINVEGSEYLSIDSYPGAFSQIITNLVLNSLIHAYEPEDSGVILIEFQERNEEFIFIYSDDGNGILPEHLKQIFDPFFTTKRNQGGNGLGLHIVYNLVTQKLLGTIECDSKLDLGTKFTIKMPIQLNTQN